MKNTSIINTPCGDIIGIDNGDYAEYRGIKYANARRWEKPVEIDHWDGVYEATKWGECCFQRRAFEKDEECNPFYHKEFRDGMSFTYSEDCQFLNIWAPKDKENCPVLIYIHGGSFTGGSADEGHVNGSEFAKNGIIFVAMNYRLGPYGFCAHTELNASNFGLHDQIASISWIRKNISAFGGDASNITLIGQSAGAMSVDIILSAPECRGWFKRAILMSGAGIQRAVSRPLSIGKVSEFWDIIIKNAGVKNMQELKSVGEKELFYAWDEACKSEKLSILNTLPSLDGEVITHSSFNMDTIPNNMEYIVGVTSADMAPIALEVLARKWAKKAGRKCYIYNFCRELPGDTVGAWHSCDLLYAFSVLDRNWRPFEDVDYRIADEISNAFNAFVKSGDPNCEQIPMWKPDYKMPLRFCEETAIMSWDTKTIMKNTFDSEKGAF